MHTFIVISHVLLCIFMILVVLLQSGKSDMGAAFGGGGGGNQNFAAATSGMSLLGKITGIVAMLFMVTSMTLAWYSNKGSRGDSVMDGDIEEMIEAQEAEDSAEKAADNAPEGQ